MRPRSAATTPCCCSRKCECRDQRMRQRRAVVTGIGVVSPIGIGKDRFWSGLREGATGIREISRFDTTDLTCHRAGEVTPFDPEPFLGRKGLKYLDRSTQLVSVATHLAI